MHFFVTGSTGFVGTGVVKELLAAGHTVTGLTRSEKGATSLVAQGAQALVGTVEDVAILKQGARAADGVIHLAFNHGVDFMAACAAEKVAVKALGEALLEGERDGGEGKKKEEKVLVVTSGTMLLLSRGGVVSDEDTPADTHENPVAAARGGVEALCHGFAKPGVLRTCVVRLPPTVHGPGNCGFVGLLARIAIEKGAEKNKDDNKNEDKNEDKGKEGKPVLAYVGDGENRWCAVHRDDAARVYVLAATQQQQQQQQQTFHAVAEEGIAVKVIAQELAKLMGDNVPVVSVPAEKAPEYFGWFAFGAAADNVASSTKTREVLGWTPQGKTLLEDIPFAVEYARAAHV